MAFTVMPAGDWPQLPVPVQTTYSSPPSHCRIEVPTHLGTVVVEAKDAYEAQAAMQWVLKGLGIKFRAPKQK